LRIERNFLLFRGFETNNFIPIWVARILAWLSIKAEWMAMEVSRDWVFRNEMISWLAWNPFFRGISISMKINENVGQHLFEVEFSAFYLTRSMAIYPLRAVA
jgi:hypothetical protein